MTPVEVITLVQRRRRWTAKHKKAMVEKAEQPGNSISSVARKYEVHPYQPFRWRRLIHEGVLQAVCTEEFLVPLSELKSFRKRIRELERLLGKKTMEVEILRDALEISHEKTDIPHTLIRKAVYPMKRITDRSNQYARGRENHVLMTENIFPLFAKLPMRGLRRVTAFLNRYLKANRQPSVNSIPYHESQSSSFTQAYGKTRLDP